MIELCRRATRWVGPCLVVSLIPMQVLAGDLVVKSRKIGHGVIALSNSQCLVVTPLHVVEIAEETGSPESVISVIGRQRERGEAELLRSSLQDVVVYSVTKPKRFCRTPKFPFSGDVETLLDSYGTGSIRYLTETGGRARIPVTISEWNDEFIHVTPLSGNGSVGEGESGSALVVGENHFIGVVLTVEGDQVKVIRKDYLARLMSPILDPTLEESEESQEVIEVRVRQLRREQLCTEWLTLELLTTSHESSPPFVEFVMRDYSSRRANFSPSLYCVQGELCRAVLDSGSYRVEFSRVTETGADFVITREGPPRS